MEQHDGMQFRPGQQDAVPIITGPPLKLVVFMALSPAGGLCYTYHAATKKHSVSGGGCLILVYDNNQKNARYEGNEKRLCHIQTGDTAGRRGNPMKTIAIVTGASGGLGREFVRLLLAGELDEVWCVARNQQKLEELKADWGHKVVPLPFDLSEQDSFVQIRRLLEQ